MCVYLVWREVLSIKYLKYHAGYETPKVHGCTFFFDILLEKSGSEKKKKKIKKKKKGNASPPMCDTWSQNVRRRTAFVSRPVKIFFMLQDNSYWHFISQRKKSIPSRRMYSDRSCKGNARCQIIGALYRVHIMLMTIQYLSTYNSLESSRTKATETKIVPCVA